MPKAAKKKPAVPVKPVAPEPPPAPVAAPTPPSLPVVYDKLEIVEYSTTSPKGPLTVEDMKGLLGWETEKEFQARRVAEEHAAGNLTAKPEHFLLGEGTYREVDGTSIPIHCKNLAGEKVVCRYNAHNRPFDEDWCESLVHTILYGQWAGPHTIPGETVNGETIRVSRYGRVLSGQHQMTACILAGEWLARARQQGTDHPDRPKYPTWRSVGKPFLETIVITGMSEDPRVLMTVDYVKPRTAADVFYTSEVFREATASDRKELCRMLASAVDTLWTRTAARGYRTHPEIVGFLERHKRLLKCVENLFAENNPNAGRKIAKLRLQPGACAALAFIQGSSGPQTDGDVYRNEEPPTERNLDWSLWDQAEKFWALLANGKDFVPVRTALGRLVESDANNEDNQGQGGRGPEKLAILANAWERWRDHRGSGAPFDLSDLQPGGCLCLSYSDLGPPTIKNGETIGGTKLPNGEIRLVDVADFYGIDCPESAGKTRVVRTSAPEPPAPSREEIERATAEALARRAKEAKK